MRVSCIYFPDKTDVSKFAEHFLRFSPQICVRENEAIFVEIGKCHRLFTEHGFTLRANVIASRVGQKAKVGIADNISMSLIHAMYGTTELNRLPLTALYDVTDPFNRDFAAREAIAIMIQALERLAIKNLEEFWKIPNHELPSRFGKVALLCKLRLNNELLVPWREWSPPEVISERVDLTETDYTGGLEPLLFEIKKLLDSMFTRLWSRGLRVAGLSLVIITERISTDPKCTREFIFDFITPQSTTRRTLDIIRIRLDRDLSRNPLRSNVEAVEIKVVNHVPGFLSQRNIFNNQEEINETQGALLNQLSEIHGSENVYYAKPVEDRLPEKSWIRERSPVTDTVNLDGIIPLRPTYLVAPEQVEVTNGKIFLRKTAFTIKSWNECAELISSHWLEKVIERIYFQVEIHGGPMLWIFQDPEKRYFLHGYFG